MKVKVGEEYKSYLLGKDIKVIKIEEDSFGNSQVYFHFKELETFVLHQKLSLFIRSIELGWLDLIKRG